MKLRLLLESEEQSSFLRFVPPSADVSLVISNEADGFPPEDGNGMDVCLSFSQANRLWREATVIHLCKQFAILHCSGELSLKLFQALGNPQLYALESDIGALAKAEAFSLRKINWLHEFYQEKGWAKVLVVSDSEAINAILCSSPTAFMHFYYLDGSFRMCLGAELKQWQGDQLRYALNLAQRISQALYNNHNLPFMIVQSCFTQNGGSAYGFFADRYDRYMAHVDYDKWYTLLSGWLNTYGNKNGKRVLELACGTAAIASRFVQAGYDVYACDLSPQMLENADKRELKPKLYQASLTSPIPYNDLDLVICVFDSINYLLHDQELLTCFKQVSQALSETGLFIFDISTLLNSMENFSEVCSVSREQDSLIVHEAYYEPGKRRQISRLELFKECGAGYSHQSELHTQRVYLAKDLQELISQSGLRLRAVHSTEHSNNMYPKKMQGIDHRYYRLFFVLSK